MTETQSRDKSETTVEIPTDGFRITELRASNVLRLVAIDITPPQDIVEVAGNNGQGKTSTLKAIEAVLRGAKAFPPRLVRDGQREARIDVDLGDFKVRRCVSPSGGMTVEIIRNEDGAKIDRPQEFLDSLIGRITFDPLDFLRDKKRRVETMLQITELEEPLDVIALKRKEEFEKRTLAKRLLRDKQGALKELPTPKNAPDAEVDTAELVARRRIAQKALDDRLAKDKALADLEAAEDSKLSAISAVEIEIARLVEIEIARLEEQLEKAQWAYEVAVDARVRKAGEILALDKIEVFELALREIDQTIETAGDQNKRFANAKSYRDQAKAVDTLEREVEVMTETIDGLDAEKLRLFEEAGYPVAGLKFGEDDLTLDGIPFEQCSDALQLRTSMEIAAATNPHIRVILLRRANDLDDQALEAVKGFAKERRFQIWLERIHPSDDASIILEEGEAIGGKAVAL
uniref:Putative ATPase domain containing protein n=1 Tax=viral metagenome TaxID=1070528 RepID=A0A6M3J9A7_9ZZZZ